jgi:hypothetical protein
MDRYAKTSGKTGDLSLIVRPDWGVGPRTAAWDRLWRAILGDIGAIPTTDAREPLESDIDDA